MDRQYNNQNKHARNMDRQYNYQKKHGQTIQRPKETWTDNTTTKRNMDRQYNDQKKVSFGSCIVCPCFFWSLYCLSMFLLIVVLPVHVSFGRYHGQAIQRPKETWTGNTTTKRDMDRQYKDQKKHLQTLLAIVLCPSSFGYCIVSFFFWLLYCLSFFFWLLYCLSFFFWLSQKKKDRQYNSQKKKDRQYNSQKKKDTIQ
jgi:hypothetical protein